jgi:hypothetical protein
VTSADVDLPYVESDDAATDNERHHPVTEPSPAFIVENFKQTMESYRSAMLAIVSFSTVLAVVNATLIGYAVNQELASILLAGPVFPITMVTGVLMVRRMQTPMVYVLLNLEHRYGSDNIDWGYTTYLAAVTSQAYVDRMLEIGHIADRRERMAAIARNPVPIIGSGHGIFRGLLLVVGLGQFLGAFVMWQFSDWRMF